MHAAVLHGIGQAPRYGTFPAPAAGEDEAVVTVTAAALKPSDRLMADGVHNAPAAFPQVAGLDGVGRLDDGTRVAFLPPVRPYGGMAEQTLIRQGMWLPVPDGVDDVTAAAFANPGMAAWKTIVWEGELASGQSVLVLGATGPSGRIAAQLAVRRGARVVVADYLWGPPAEAVFAGLMRLGRGSGTVPGAGAEAGRIRYILVGMTAGEVAGVSALALRSAPVQLAGSGIGGPASLAETAAPTPICSGRWPRARWLSRSRRCRWPRSRRRGRGRATAGASSSCRE